MKVQLSSVDDFLDELERDKQFVRRGIVRVRIDSWPKNDTDEIWWKTGFWATAIIDAPDDKYLLELSYVAIEEDKKNDECKMLATQECQDEIARIMEMAERSALEVRSGKLEVI